MIGVPPGLLVLDRLEDVEPGRPARGREALLKLYAEQHANVYAGVRTNTKVTHVRLLGKDVTFYRFPGEGHELSRSGSPIHRRQRAEIILDFFAKHLA